MKKFVLALLAVVLVLGLCTVAYAQETATECTETHVELKWRTVAEPTCTESAVVEQYCTECGKVVQGPMYTHEDTSLGHDLTDWIVSGSDKCLSENYRYQDCKRCFEKKVTQEIFGVVPHVMDDTVVVPATCLTKGERLWACENCDFSYTEEINYLGDGVKGHNWEDRTIANKTCTEDGYKTEQCIYCGEWKHTELKAEGHKLSKTEIEYEVAPTCTEDGKGTAKCTVCGKWVATTFEATGHNWSAWYVDEAATCTQDGYRSRDCMNTWCRDQVSNLPAQEQEVLPKLGHDVTAYTVTKAPKCEEVGTKIGGCNRCFTIVTEEIPATGHLNWTEWTVVGDCKVRTCKDCHKIETCTECPVDPETPVVPDAPAGDDDDNESEGGSSSTGSGSDASIPATGDNTSNVPYIMMVAAVAGLVVLVASKRKVNC